MLADANVRLGFDVVADEAFKRFEGIGDVADFSAEIV